jgi:hypothetical protein
MRGLPPDKRSGDLVIDSRAIRASTTSGGSGKKSLARIAAIVISRPETPLGRMAIASRARSDPDGTGMIEGRIRSPAKAPTSKL